METSLKGQNILFICPVFHNYHELIIDKLRSMGATVDFFPERKYGAAFKIINNFSPKNLVSYQKAHYDSILESSRDKNYDYLFIIRGFMISEDFLEKFTQEHPNTRRIMYQWDSQKTNPFSHLIPHLDQVLSFDFEDCENYPQVKYLPLFFTDDVAQVNKNKNSAEYDFFFMGWFFPERYESVLKFKAYCKEHNYSIKAYLYMPYTSYIKERLKGNRIDKSIVSFKHMSRRDYLSNLGNSRVMVDVSNPNQTGLSMRVIESLASHTKVLTNNLRLKEDKSVYEITRVAFFNEKNPSVNDDLFKVIDNSGRVGVLSLEEWLKTIFTLK